jgi:drug/metabolite transporter (DMT)-like permease
MDWILLAFLAPVFWAAVNVIDKFLMTKKFKNPYSYQVWLTLIGIAFVFIFFLLFPISFNYLGILLGIFAGMMSVVSFILYNKAMLLEEASRIIPLCYLSTLFTIPLAYVFLAETLSTSKYLGIFSLVIGAMLISYRRGKKKWILSPAIKLVLMIAFILACMGVIEKYVLGFIDQFSLLFWMMIGSTVGSLSLLLSKKIKRNFYECTRRIDRITILLSIINLIFVYSAYILFFTALSEGFVSLVMGIVSVQPFILLFYTTMLTLFFPRIIRERIDKATIILKLIAICLTFFGSWLAVS